MLVCHYIAQSKQWYHRQYHNMLLELLISANHQTYIVADLIILSCVVHMCMPTVHILASKYCIHCVRGVDST